MHNVYAIVNSDGVITAVNSSAFLPDAIVAADGWVKIDEGNGERFSQAQGNYLTAGLTDENGINNYKLSDGAAVLRTVEDKAPELAATADMREIVQLKQQLNDTDYIPAKIAEGAATIAEYADEIAQRAAWRVRINELGG